MASNNSGSQGFSVFLERMRERFTKDRSGTRYADEDKPRGFAITVCVLISVVLWFTITMQKVYTVSLELPTRVVSVPEDQALTSLPPPEVRAQVRGQGFSLLQLRYRPPVIELSASGQQVRLQDVAANQLPGGVEVQGFSPQTVMLQKGPRITRKVPIRVRAHIETPGTYDLLKPPRVKPDSVEITGAQSIVSNAQYWPTQPFEYEGLKDSLVVRVPLSDSLDGLVQKSLQSTTLYAVSRMFTEGSREIDVIVTGVPSNEEMKVVTLEQESIRVRYNVLFSQYEEAQRAPDFFATVPYEDIRQDTTGRLRPKEQLPEGIVLRDVELIPPTLRYYNVLVDE